MSKWPGKYVIGLTGNIGTGKSVVRRMLEHLGAYGIDADALVHRAIAKGAPGYQAVVKAFGTWILGPDEQIDRNRLGRLVFSEPEALVTLEKIVHPLVAQAVDFIVQHATQPVIVIEAIKLLESGMAKSCDKVMVTYAPPETQIARLTQNRHMTEAEARQRITAQPPQEQKMAAAGVVIRNIGTFEDTWRQVVTAWQKFAPAAAAEPEPVKKTSTPQGELSVLRGAPRHSAEIADLINKLKQTGIPLTRADIMAAFGERAFMILQVGPNLVGVIGWQVENLVSRTTDIYIDPSIPVAQALPVLVNEMERASKDLQCEASLIFATPDLAQDESLWKGLGYERRTPDTLGVLAWQEAAQESMPANTVLLFKKLRQDRVLRPI
ncbi:MAG TPA: dephospho-CoA kinase [Anaerolineaceae bacterium]|nr:dephospho-CoA kinase [Anaerolineaceae bacterium]HQH87128.1 dephospho-CoA kinase [Anaerolineaceae bacterium]